MLFTIWRTCWYTRLQCLFTTHVTVFEGKKQTVMSKKNAGINAKKVAFHDLRDFYFANMRTIGSLFLVLKIERKIWLVCFLHKIHKYRITKINLNILSLFVCSLLPPPDSSRQVPKSQISYLYSCNSQSLSFTPN